MLHEEMTVQKTLQQTLRQTQDAREAAAAFADRRKPVFKGL
jgi:hypothetical protein